MVFIGRRASAMPFLERSAVDEEAPLSPRGVGASRLADSLRRDVEAQATPPASPRRHRPSRLCSDPNAVGAHLAKLIRQHSNPDLEADARGHGLPRVHLERAVGAARRVMAMVRSHGYGSGSWLWFGVGSGLG